MRKVAFGLAMFLLGLLITGVPSSAQAIPRISFPMLGAATTGTGPAVFVGGYNNLTVYITGTGTVSSGTLLIEEAYWDESQGYTAAYTGTWSQIKSLTGGTDFGTNAQTGYHLTTSAYSHVRARISSNIGGGGNITVWLIGQ